MNPVIFALDYSTLKEAHSTLKKIKSSIGMIKIGLELYTSYGPHILELGRVFNLPIFLDLKLFDIPNTIEKTVSNIVKISDYYDIRFLTVHSFGGEKMLKSAVRTAHNSGLNIASVAVLTSFDEVDLYRIGIRNATALQQTVYLSNLAKNCGVRSFVCSAMEAATLRRMFGQNVEIICPGIRLNNNSQDQKRIATPTYALQQGASKIVIGRSISQSNNPNETAKQILKEITK